MPEPGPATAPPGTYLAFDFGLRRIGVAVGQTTTRTASPLAVVENADAMDWDAIDALLKEWRPVALVLGLPMNGEGEETTMSREARRFGSALHRRTGLPVHYHDERLSSRVAGERFREQRASGGARRKDVARLDAVAASIILEQWLVQRQLQGDTRPAAMSTDSAR